MSSIAVILISLLASTFFSGMEIAFFSADRLRLELDKRKSIGFWERCVENPVQYTAAMLVGNSIALITLCIASIFFLYPHLSAFHSLIPIIILVIAISIVFLIAGYLLPKTIFNINPNKILNFFWAPAAFFFYVFYPITWTGIFIFKLLSGERDYGAQFFPDKINGSNFIREVESSKEDTHHEFESEMKLFKNALEFTKVRVRDCMVQRTDMEIMEESSGIEELRQKFTETGFSKILIYKDHIDNITGYVHSFDLFNEPENISSCLREISFVPETMEAKKLLSKLLKEHKSIAIVVDEFGGTAGMITTEDILEEIFGEIEDEHDKPDFISKKVDENRYIFSGRMEIETINELYDLDLEIDISYETIAGYILYHHSSFPKSNSILQIGRHEFRILRSSRTSIDLVEMRILEK